MSREVIYMARGRPFICPYCKTAGKNVRKGFRQTKLLGLRKIRYCKNCKRKFTPKNQKPAEEQ
jgi:transcriptional regulator NrdR family protein